MPMLYSDYLRSFNSFHISLKLKSNESKQGCKVQESIQSSTTPDPGYQWESDKLTVDTTNYLSGSEMKL